MLRTVLALVLMLLPNFSSNSTQAGEVAVYRGRTYTQTSFPRAEWCNCPMCQSIRTQWARVRVRSTPVVARAKVKTVSKVQRVKRTRTVMRSVSRCKIVRGRKQCFRELVPVQETYWVEVPVNEVQSKESKVEESEEDSTEQKQAEELPDTNTNTELHTTPDEAVQAVFEIIPHTKGSVFLDLGCGDGKLLEAAHSKGFQAVGVELDPVRVRRTRIRLRGRATIIEGDVRDVSLSTANVIYLWLYPSLISQLELPSTATVVSYRHKIPRSKLVVVNDHEFYVRRPY